MRRCAGASERARSNTVTVPDAVEHALDDGIRTSIIRNICRDETVGASTASAWLEGALQFLDLCGLSDASSAGTAVPSLAVDAAWHSFILHTSAYSDYCQQR